MKLDPLHNEVWNQQILQHCLLETVNLMVVLRTDIFATTG